ncbi:hypothetical protein QFZ28_006002 [Neobacillus niacini]|uniref:DUF5677 domain-containing protein n=1 Tax=Neobacillus niacini TaxID=86668 RepID=UPI0027819462|nr:DUF5677 domain-containing protein [Neobacillus niacini]MDQ1005424.1 hypothetical protein [Neobacillus niacini]
MKTLKRLIKEGDKVFNTVIRDYFQNGKNNVEFGYTDAVVLGLLENLINHSKSIVILLENKHHSSLDSILRTVFENFVYLKFIFQKDTTRRARSYDYSNRIKIIGLAEKLTEDSMDGVKMREFLEMGKDTVLKEITKGIDDEFKANTINGYLKEIGMQRKEQKWYNLDGKTNNLKAVCSQLDLLVQYDLLYPILSIETHGKNAIRNFSFWEKRVDLLNIMKNEEFYISLSSIYVMESIKLIYSHYKLKKALKSFETIFALNVQFK